MTATNHALTGAAIGLIIGQPLLAIPAALLSHFICDALPHFGAGKKGDSWIKTATFKKMLLLDAFLCLLLVAVLATLQPAHWFLASVCAFLATSPDLLSINRFIIVNSRKRKAWKPNTYSKFAHGIQWFEKPIGAVVETAWVIAMITLLVPFVK